MKRVPPHRYAAILALGCALMPGSSSFASRVQEEASPTAVLLGRARTLEQRGRLDLARQDWAEVLSLDPNDAEALAGLVRAARAEGKAPEANQYLARLRAAHPKDPELARLEGSNKAQDANADLAKAAQLAKAGDNAGALAIYRRVYGLYPPAGAPALAYYEAEAGTDAGRPHAIAGLRAMADRFPADTRYQIALGRVLLASPRTRAEGRTILERYPENGEAVAALHTPEPGAERASVAAPSTPHKAEPLPMPSAVARPAETPARPAAPVASTPSKPAPGTPLKAPVAPQHSSEQASVVRAPAPAQHVESPRPPATAAVHTVAAQGAGRHQAFAAQEQAGFTALNQHRVAEAEQLFRDILSKDPTDPRALAGLGYLSQTTGDLKAAVTFFEEAQENGDRSLALTRALVNAQFELALHQAAAQRSRGNLADAEAQYRTALRERPSDPEALEGLASLLLQTGRMEDAIPVYTRLTQVRPMDPGAWRGLVISQASAGKGAAALSADARVPADAKNPLLQDPSYRQALATARGEQGTQVAKAEPPPPPPSVSAPVRPAPTPAAPPAATVPAPSTPATKQPAPTPAPASVAVKRPPVDAPKPVPAPAPATVAVNRPAVETPKPAAPPSKPAPSETAKAAAPARPQRPANTRRAPAPAVASAPPPPQPAPTPAPAAIAAPQPAPGRIAVAAERTSQGENALERGENGRAADLFRDALRSEPESTAAWRGLIEALHAGGQNSQAVAALSQIPDVARGVLDRDATFQAAVGGVYMAADRPNEALGAFARAQEVFASQKLPPPLDLVLRIATLLAARNDDGNLYRELIYLGDRRDLNDTQRRDVQMIWTSWAVRRARILAVAGEQRRSVVILNAAAEAFAGNPAVLSAVADGYAGVGLPREAVALYKARDLTNASARELETAIAAGIAAHDFRTAESWAHLGRQRFPADPEMLTAVAELEQARGHEGRALELSKQAKALAPVQDPGQVLTAELREARAGQGWHTGNSSQLSVLLAPAEAGSATTAAPTSRPFLPASGQPVTTPDLADKTPVLAGYNEPSR